MASWRDYAARQGEEPEARANSAKRANSPALAGSTVANGAIGTNGTALPSAVTSGLTRLHAMGVPRGADPRAWALAVKDAARLVDDGFAAQALGLGWSAIDLFGGQVDRTGDPHADGLAAWLQGRRVVALTDAHAIASDANGGRHYFNRPRAPGAVLMWALGSGR